MKVIILADDHEREDAEWLRDELYERVITEEVDVEIEHASRSVAGEVAERLASHHNGNAPSMEKIRQWCEEAEKQFIDAPIRVFVPVLVENIVRRRMELEPSG